MKRQIIFAITSILIGLYTANAQDYWTTIYTPTGILVEAIVKYEFNADELALVEQDAANWIKNHKSKAMRIASASRSYNCHSFAWHYSDGGSKVWIYQTNSYNQPNLAKYWSTSPQTYVTSNSLEGQKVFYPNGDHSARTTSSSGTFESKWGAWPRYRHTWNDCPYTSTGLQYYKVNMTGDNIICNGTSGSFTTLDITNLSGSTYTWSGTNLTVSVSNNTANATSTSQGNGEVFVSIYSSKSKTTINAKKSVWIGVPSLSYIDGPQHANSAQSPELYFAMPVNSLADASYTWQVNPYYYSLWASSNWASIAFPYDGDFTVSVNAQNTCGTSNSVELFVAVGIYEPFKVTPNPASDYLTVTIADTPTPDVLNDANKHGAFTGKNTGYGVQVVNSMGLLVYSAKSNGSQFNVPTSTFKNGHYIIIISDGRSSFRKGFMVNH